MEAGLDGQGRGHANVHVLILGAQLEWRLNTLVLGIGGCSLETARDSSPVGPDFVKVDGSGDDLDVVEAELRALGNCRTVRGAQG